MDLIKKAAMNPINKKDITCFQYTITVILDHKEIKKTPAKNLKNQDFYKQIWLEQNKLPIRKRWLEKNEKKSNNYSKWFVRQKRKNISCSYFKI